MVLLGIGEKNSCVEISNFSGSNVYYCPLSQDLISLKFNEIFAGNLLIILLEHKAKIMAKTLSLAFFVEVILDLRQRADRPR